MEQKAGLRARTQTELRTKARVDPKIVLASKLLQLQQQELDQAIEQELNDNPALERIDPEPDGDAEIELVRRFLHQKAGRLDDDESFHHQSASESHDWTEFVPAPFSLHDHLAAQFLPMVEPEEDQLARHILDCVNESGYLDLPVEEIALLAGADLDTTRSLVKMLQTCDPAGVGAHNLQECLFLQLVDAEDPVGTLARTIVSKHWDALLRRQPKGIARRYRVSREDVAAAFARIASLWPYPGEAFHHENIILRQPSRSVVPDVVFGRDSNGMWIEVHGCDPADFMINKGYLERYRVLRSGLTIADADERTHVGEFVGRAMMFIRAIHQRRRTLRRIAECLLREQFGFITTGSYDFLKPLTRISVARSTSMHESTVSRATMNKFVQIINGEVVPFEVFFKPALRVQKMIEEILMNENPSSPLPDRVISEILAKRGVHVARRTVSKYREQIRLLASHRRRSA